MAASNLPWDLDVAVLRRYALSGLPVISYDYKAHEKLTPSTV